MKKLWIGTVVCGGLIAGISLAYAKIIPGVDEPFNPSAYYSSTEISYADSPSTFFYRDLSRGGNIVYDPERHKKSILSCLKYDELLKTLRELFQKNEEDKTPFGNDGIKVGLQEAQQQTASLNLAKSITDKAEKVFPNKDLNDSEFTNRSLDKQMEFLNDVYKQVSINAQKSVQNSVERQKLLEEGMKRSSTAQGSLQAEQAASDVQALIQEEYAERNMILGNIAAMDAVTQRYKLTKEMVDTRNRMDIISQFGFSDPYHYDAYEKRHYEKPEPLGLPDF